MQADLELQRTLRLERRRVKIRRLNRAAAIFGVIAGILAIAAVPGRALVAALIRLLA